METNLITEAVELLGPGRLAGLNRLAKACGVSYQAVLKWEKAGRLPRTEWTGDTNYSWSIEQATGGQITRKALLRLKVA